MNTGYLVYQAERTKSAAEQREIDRSNGQLAASVGRRWRALTAPFRRLAGPFRLRAPVEPAGAHGLSRK